MKPLPKEGDVLAARYRIVRSLGRGAHGEVFVAHDIDLARAVAIKEVVTSDLDAKRLEREARNAAKLDARVVVGVLEAHLDHDPPFLVSELARGRPLASFVGRPFREERAIAIAKSLLDALVVAHEAGIFHGDLRPSNIFVEGGDVQLGDFGFAVDDTEEGRSATDLSSSKSVVGYRAPERIRGGAPDVRSDLFAVGVCLFEMLAGRRPFEAGAPVDEIAAILREPTPHIRAHCNDVVARALDKDPAARFANAKAMRAALERRRLLPWFVVSAIALPIAIAVWASLTLTRVERARDLAGDAASTAMAPSATAEASVVPEVVSVVSAEASAPLAPAVARPRRARLALPASATCPVDSVAQARLAMLQPSFDECAASDPDTKPDDRYVVSWTEPGSDFGVIRTASAHGSSRAFICFSAAAHGLRMDRKWTGCALTITVVH